MSRRRRYESPISLFSFQDIVTSVTGVLILTTLLLTTALVTREFGSPAVQSMAVAEDVGDVLDQTRQDISMLRQRLNANTDRLTALAGISPTQVQRDIHDLQQQMGSLNVQIESLADKVDETEGNRRKWKSRELTFDEIAQRLHELQQEHDRLVAERNKLLREDRLIYNPQQATGKAAWLVDIADGQILAARVGVKEKPQEFRSSAAFLRWARSRDVRGEYFVLLVRPSGIDAYESIFVELRDASYDLGVDLIGQSQTVIDPQDGAGGLP